MATDPIPCVGFPTGTKCDSQAEYTVLRLCRTCYQRRRRHIGSSDFKEDEAPPHFEPPGVRIIEDGDEDKDDGTPKQHPKHKCPLCGQHITRAQARSDKAMHFNPDLHPIQLKRALAVNKTRSSIAKRFGITEAALNTWIEQFPEMQAAADAVEAEDEVLYEAAVVKALGTRAKTGEYMGGDAQLLKLLIQYRHGITDRKPPADNDAAENLKKMTTVAENLLKKFEGITEGTANTGEST